MLPKLMMDQEYGEETTEDLKELLENLRKVSEKLGQGEGTVARLLNDPEIYQALNDILIGVDESWMLRWLIRNRQKTGIEERYEDERPMDNGSEGDPAGGRDGG